MRYWQVQREHRVCRRLDSLSCPVNRIGGVAAIHSNCLAAYVGASKPRTVGSMCQTKSSVDGSRSTCPPKSAPWEIEDVYRHNVEYIAVVTIAIALLQELLILTLQVVLEDDAGRGRGSGRALVRAHEVG